MPTIDDVVRVSGVSRSTVFRFLNGKAVRPALRSAIQTALRELNYAYNPRSSHSDVVLVISVKDHFEGSNAYAEMISGIMRRAEVHGLNVQLHAGSNPATEDIVARKGARIGVLIIGKTDREELAEADAYRALGIPHLFLNRLFENLSISSVSVDLRAAAKDAVSHLLTLGHRRIGTWGRPENYSIDRQKIAGLRDAYLERGLIQPPLVFTYDRDGDLEDVARRLFKCEDHPHAWLGLSDSHLMRLIPILREAELRVPEDVALVGMDDIEASKFFSPSISSVHIPFRTIGETSVDLILDLLENTSTQSVRWVLQHELIVRESCGAKGVKNG